MKHSLWLAGLLFLAGCGESDDDIYNRAYEEGYNKGQYDVCRELGSIALNLKGRLRNCRGY
ncbi:MAG: hypothetical protein ACFCUT_22125 [Kiloniellaceae bacterium]